MKISELCIRRPVLATVMNILIVLLGVVAYERLTVREFPDIEVPVVSVETFWRGASAEVMTSQVTKPLEDALSGLEGVDYMTSTTRAESSQINLNFKIGRNADDAAADVRDRVARARGTLPDEIDEPIVAKTEADATPIIYLALASDTVSPLEVTDIADRVVQDRLQILTGVARAEIYGNRRYAMRIWLDAQKLGAFQLTPADVENALRSQNIEVPGGRVEDKNREFTVRAESDLQTPEQFAAVIIRQQGDYAVRLGDVARVEIAAEDERVVARHNGKPAVAIGVIKQSTANPLDVSKAVAEAITVIQPMLPAGVTLSVAYDSTVFISASLESVVKTMLEAIALVAVVIFLFLRSARASLIPIITIPISLTGALVLLYVLGFSINTLTLLAFVLAIGLVVDDAIVMLENVQRYIEGGMKPLQAALKGSKEIGFAIIAMTLTLAAVYAPMALAEGRTGKLFTEFALALAGAVVVSGFIALTLAPMLSAYILKPVVKVEAEPRYVSRYREMLTRALERPRRTFVLAGLSLFFSSIFLFGVAGLASAVGLGAVFEKPKQAVAGLMDLKNNLDMGIPIPVPEFVKTMAAASPWASALLSGLPRELAPSEDQGFFIGIGFTPEGSTIDYTAAQALKIEEIYKTIPEQYMYFVVNGFSAVTQMLSFVVMKPWAERERDIKEIANSVGGAMFSIPGFNFAIPFTPPSLGQDFLNTDIAVVLQTTGSWQELEAAVGQLMGKLVTNPMFVQPRPDLELNKPELRVLLNRDKIANVGASVAEVGAAIETMLSGSKVTRFKKNGEQYEVIVQLAPDARRKPADLTGIYVRGTGGQMVQLANLVTIEETVAPKELKHFDKLKAASITATLAPGASEGAALAYIQQAVKDIGAANMTLEYAGTSREYMQAGGTIVFVFILALVFIYLVLAAQFESFIDPLVILVSVPLAAFGALLVLWIFGGSFNIFSQIGLITLVGLIAKNGILIVEFANQLQEEGRQKLEAVIEASTLRLRPILMTSAATVIGAVPLALASGAGAESRETIGLVIVGGMTIGTMFTLFVIPAVYMAIGQRKVAHAEAA